MSKVLTKFSLGLIVGFLLSTVLALAIPAPPPLADSPTPLQHYLQTMYENHNRLQVVTSNPDGSTPGKRGDMLLLQTGGVNYLQVNTDSDVEWRGIALSNTP